MKIKSLRNIALRFNCSASMSVQGIQETLLSAGCDSVTYSDNGQRMSLGFTRGSERYRINVNTEDVLPVLVGSDNPSHTKCREHAERVCLWAIRHLIESQITCVSIGALTFEEAFFQFLVAETETLSTVFELAAARRTL